VTRRQELVIFAVLAVLVVVAAYLLLLRPQRSAIAQARADERTAQADSQSIQDRIRALEALKANEASLRADAKRAREQFPASPDLPALVDALQGLASQSGVDLSSVAPSTPKASTVRPELAEIDTAVTVSGGYFEIEDFLARLENLVKGSDPDRVPPRSVLVRSVALSSASSGGAGASGDSAGTAAGAAASADGLQASIALTVFQLAQAQTAAAPAAGGVTAASGAQGVR
jgi:Pilus assembly protein, PilO